MSRARICPQCSLALREVEYGSGTVWSCDEHGVKSWFFDGSRSEGLLFRIPDFGVTHAGDVQRRPGEIPEAPRGPAEPPARRA